ncbi:class I poly(R)-hydroxyalkanoic acid synthase, partial [Escherichia coli]
TGVLEGSRMEMAFNMLRSNDLIWSYVVNNYLQGQPPAAFDLLHWNSDATRMPAANHSYYLRNCYLDNRLSTGSMVLDDTVLDLSMV